MARSVVKANEPLDGKPERGSLSPEEYAKKMRNQPRAKMQQGRQEDHDRER
jgi:hypothetical protein